MVKEIFIKGLTGFLVMLSLSLSAQESFQISGRVTHENGEVMIGANVIVKGLVVGTITDLNGQYEITIRQEPPYTLQFSYIGHETVSREVDKSLFQNGNQLENLDIILKDQSILGQEVVISASRIEESILQSPVTIEKMDILAIRETASDNYYKSLANLKGIDVASSSINFQILNARGFGSTGNVRFVQLIDGMDTQAPALNFPIGNLNGPSELDVESIELIPGASSALYGPNAFNGIVLINSKNPFLYQGLSAFAKVGVNHVGNSYQNASPMFEGSIRYAKAYKNKFAYKVSLSYQRAEDWWGRNFDDRNPERQGELSFNPGRDIVHQHGDEAGINLAIFPLSSNWRALARTIGQFEAGLTAETYALNGDLPSTTVTLTPYEEQHIVDYGSENLKANIGLNYRITDKLEAVYMFNGGYGTSVYTGAQRYSLQNFIISQHKLELKGDNFMVRGYTTLENSGDSYIAEFLALKVNESWIAEKWAGIAPDPGVSTWLGGYGIKYLEHLYNIGLAPGEINSLTDAELIERTGKNRIQIQEDGHLYARQLSDEGRYEGGTEEFEAAKKEGKNGVIPDGATFADKSNLIQFDAQYDFKNEISFMELQAGIMYHQFNLNSNGTIFDDKGGLSVREWGGFVQGRNWFLHDHVRLVGSIRYDKNENFTGRVNPRISTIFNVAENHNFRLSYQTGFRNPTTQNQHIDLDVISRRLLGGLPKYIEKYQVDQNAYTLSSVETYTKAVLDNGATTESLLDDNLASILIQAEPYLTVEPEEVQSFEAGYKSLLSENLLIDIVGYFNNYDNFISAYRVRKANGDINATDPTAKITARSSLLNGTSDNSFDVATNFREKISAWGIAAGFNYSLPKGYLVTANYNWNVLDKKTQEENPDFQFAFNTPEHKVNLGFGNRNLTEHLGFNISYRWQTAYLWESTFAIGEVEKISLVDAQVSYKLSRIKSILKLGGSNLLNTKYVFNYGGPEMGAIYYLSITFDEFLN